MSRYYLSEKDGENKRHNFPKSKIIKRDKKEDFSLDDQVFDPYHGSVPIPKNVLEKYQRGKRLDAVNISLII